VLGCDPIAVEADHIGMCKPASRDAQIYRSTAALLRDLLAAGASSVAIHARGNGASCIAVDDGVEGLEPELLADYQNFTTKAPDDRQTLAEKLTTAGRSYLVKEGERKKERFSMTLQRHIAQPAALAHYTRMMASIEARFNRHVARAIALNSPMDQVDQIVQRDVIDPVLETHHTAGADISAATVDNALYYLTGNCHLRWKYGDD
jgi:protein SERAC1